MKRRIIISISVLGLSVSTLIYIYSLIQLIVTGSKEKLTARDGLVISPKNTKIDIEKYSHDDPQKCSKCNGARPCSYPTSVDIRIFVLAFDRSSSLHTCLRHIEASKGDLKVAVEVWIDRAESGSIPVETVKVAEEFQKSSKLFNVCVNVQQTHAFIAKQWINAWRPQENSKEIGLFIEDDVDTSPFALKWLMAVHSKYAADKEIYGYSLQMEHVMAQTTKHKIITAPSNETVFKMPILGTYGFSPKANFWRAFQDWYYKMNQNKEYRPYVEGLRANGWYKGYERNGFQDSMGHEMWFIHYVFNHRQKLYCLYSNLAAFTGHPNSYLSSHRAEKGLHAKGSTSLNKQGSESQQEWMNQVLLRHWNSSFVTFPDQPVTFDAFGNREQQLEQW